MFKYFSSKCSILRVKFFFAYLIHFYILSSCSNKDSSINPVLKNELNVYTVQVSNIGKNYATLIGNTYVSNGIIIEESGFLIDTTELLNTKSTKLIATNPYGTFNYKTQNLKSYQKYYVKAYSKSKSGIFYGDIVSFKTLGYTYVPDDSFENYLISAGFDTTLDDSVVTNNIDTLSIIKLSEPRLLYNLLKKPVKNLIGLQDFKNLKELYCANQELYELDLTSNFLLKKLQCPHNKLKNLDVSKNPNLTSLDFWDNKLSNIDVRNNKKLEILSIGVNQIKSIDISNNTALKEIDFQSGVLSKIDLSNNLNLERLYVMDNQLSSLDVSKNLKLTDIWADNNQIENIDVSNNLKLNMLILDNNKISKLDVSNNLFIRVLEVQNNKLSFLNLGNLKSTLELLETFNNPELFCIQVNDPEFFKLKFITNKKGTIDPISVFNLKCNGN